MSCEHCTGLDGESLYPYYGLAPHCHVCNNMIGSTVFTGEKVDGFTPDNDDPRMGIWWCPNCGEGNPRET